jgi:hypothetical protein
MDLWWVVRQQLSQNIYAFDRCTRDGTCHYQEDHYKFTDLLLLLLLLFLHILLTGSIPDLATHYSCHLPSRFCAVYGNFMTCMVLVQSEEFLSVPEGALQGRLQPVDDPQFHWWLKQITDRRGGQTGMGAAPSQGLADQAARAGGCW